MRQGDHYCVIYKDEASHQRLIADYLREGVERGEKLVYFANAHHTDDIRRMLEQAGIPVEELLTSGQLRLLTARETYLEGGEFNPTSMIHLLRLEEQMALSEGYTGLRATGEMAWALSGEPGSERLMEYEARLNKFFQSSRITGLCQYDQRRFDAEALLDVLHTHPKVLVGTDACDNSRRYFIPTSSFLGADRQGAMLDRWVENLVEHGAPSAG